MTIESTSQKDSESPSDRDQLAEYQRWLLVGTGIALVAFFANVVPKRLTIASIYQTGDIDPTYFPGAIGWILIGAALLVAITAWLHRTALQASSSRVRSTSWMSAYGPSMVAFAVALIMLNWHYREPPEAVLFEPAKISNGAPLFALVDGSRVSYLITYERDPTCENERDPYSKALSGIKVGMAQQLVLDPLVQALSACSPKTAAERGVRLVVRGYASSSHVQPDRACRNPCEAEYLSANACIAKMRAEAVGEYLSNKAKIPLAQIALDWRDNPGTPLLYVDKPGAVPKYSEQAGTLNRRVEITIKSAGDCDGAGDIASKPRLEDVSVRSTTAPASH